MADVERQRTHNPFPQDRQPQPDSHSLDAISDTSLRTLIGKCTAFVVEQDPVIVPAYLESPLQDMIGITSGQCLDIIEKIRHRKIVDTVDGVRIHDVHRYKIIGFNHDQVLALTAITWMYKREFEEKKRRLGAKYQSRVFREIDWNTIVRETKDALGTYYVRELIHDREFSQTLQEPFQAPVLSPSPEVIVPSSYSRFDAISPQPRREMQKEVTLQPRPAYTVNREVTTRSAESLRELQPKREARPLSKEDLQMLSQWDDRRIQAALERLKFLSQVDVVSATIISPNVIEIMKTIVSFRMGNSNAPSRVPEDDVMVGDALKALSICKQ